MIRTVGKNKKKQNDWFDKECTVKKRYVKILLKRFQRSKKGCNELRVMYVKERKEYKQLLFKNKSDFDQVRLTQLQQSINDPKLFWKTIRSVGRKRVICNNITKEQWYKHFFNVFNAVTFMPDETDMVAENEEIRENQFNEAISKQEISGSIQKLKSGKSAVPDKIVSEMLKHTDDTVIDFLVALFNQLFNLGAFPLEWSKSIIVPSCNFRKDE